MKRSNFIIAVALIASIGFVGWTRDFTSSARGTTTANFLKLGVGARAIAMGEAYAAVADDANALYWNPAALTRISRYSATLMHAPYLASTYYDYAAYAQHLGIHGALGGGIQYFSSGRLTETDVSGTDVGDFTPYDLAVSLGYAYEISGYSLGITGKFIRSKIVNTATTGAADVGILSRPFLKDRLRLAATATHIGGKMRFIEVSQRLPMALRLGSSYQVTARWLGALDIGMPVDNNPYVALGSEYRWMAAPDWPVAMRAGYNSQTTADVDGMTGFSFGVGTDYHGLGVDYAVQPLGSLGLTHRISVNFKFFGSEDPHILKTTHQLPDEALPPLPLLFPE